MHHPRTFHRSTYYSAPAAQPVLQRRSVDNDGDIKKVWSILGPFLVALFSLIIVLLLVRLIKDRLTKRRLARKAEGPCSHLQTGSLLSSKNKHGATRQPAQSAFVGRPLPHPDEYELGFITQPRYTHARLADSHMQRHTSVRTPARQPVHVSTPLTTNPFEDIDGPALGAWDSIGRSN